jgi:hypothetical protein
VKLLAFSHLFSQLKVPLKAPNIVPIPNSSAEVSPAKGRICLRYYTESLRKDRVHLLAETEGGMPVLFLYYGDLIYIWSGDFF